MSVPPRDILLRARTNIGERRDNGPTLLEDIIRAVDGIEDINRLNLDIADLSYSNGMVSAKLIISRDLLTSNNIIPYKSQQVIYVNFNEEGVLLPRPTQSHTYGSYNIEPRASIVSRMLPITELNDIKYIVRTYLKFFRIPPQEALEFLIYSSHREGSRVQRIVSGHLTRDEVYEELVLRVKAQELDSAKTIEEVASILRTSALVIHRGVAPLDMTFEYIAYKLSSFDITPKDSIYDLLSYVDWVRTTIAGGGSTIADRMSEISDISSVMQVPVSLVVSVDEGVLEYINRYIHGEYRGIIQDLELVVPPNIRDEVYLEDLIYILSGLLIDRSEGSTAITSYSDEELIMTYYAAYPYYQSRRELISSLESLRSTRGFFMPTTRRCKNAETYLYTPTSDESIQMISYGIIEDYVCHEVEELESSFNNTETYPFISPSRDFTYTEAEVGGLKNLTSIYPSMRELGRIIDRGSLQIERDTQLQGEQLRLFKSISIEDRDKIRTIFRTLLEAAMYMRRWTGKGPYPLKKEQTLYSEIDPIVNATPALNALMEGIDELRGSSKKFMKNVELFRPVGGELVADGTLLAKIRSIYAGDTCIRMASKPLIITAVKFLTSLFGEEHPELTPDSIDTIS